MSDGHYIYDGIIADFRPEHEGLGRVIEIGQEGREDGPWFSIRSWMDHREIEDIAAQFPLDTKVRITVEAIP